VKTGDYVSISKPGESNSTIMEGKYLGDRTAGANGNQIHYDMLHLAPHLRLLKIHSKSHPFLSRWRRRKGWVDVDILMQHKRISSNILHGV